MNRMWFPPDAIVLAQDDVYVETPVRATSLELIAKQVRARVERVSLLDAGIVLAAVAAAVAIIGLLSRWNRRLSAPSDNPEWLFQELCRAHALAPGAIRLLKALAASRGEKPAMMFVMPELFAKSSLPAALRSQERAYEELAAHLFA